MLLYNQVKKYFEGEVFNVLEGLDFGQIMIMLDYYLRKIMSLLDSLLGLLGSETPEGSSDITDELV